MAKGSKPTIESLGTKRNYGNFISGYLNYTEHLESPTEFHVWTAISIIAGALQGKCFLNMGYFKWKPNCFIIFVAPPGIVAKSTTSGVGTDLLRGVPGISFGPNICTWQAMLQSFEIAQSTYEVDGKKMKMSNLTLEASELGTFLNFDDKQMIDVIVDLWDGKDKPLVKTTVGGGEMRIESPWVNMIACTTPSWITCNMPQYSIGGGFASRCIFVYADKKAKFIPYPDDYVPAGWANEKRKLTEDLIRISRISGEFKLSPEAREFGKDWYIKFHEEMPSHLKDDQLAGYAARKQTHLHKIAMCLSAARGDSKVIELEDMEMAISLLQVSEENMLKVFQSISDDKDATNLKIIKGKMALYPEGITQSDLYCDMSTRMGYDAFTRALDAGVSAGFFERVLRRNETVIRNATQAARNSVNVSKEDVARVKSLRKKA